MAKHYRKPTFKERFVECFVIITLAAALIAAANYFLFQREEAVCACVTPLPSPSAAESKDITSEDEEVSAGSDDIAALSNKIETKETQKTEPVKEFTKGDAAQIAIIVDDGGVNLQFAHRLAALDLPLTWAVMPYLGHTSDIIKLAKEKNIPFIVHLPMKVKSDKDPSDYIIGNGMTCDEVRKKTAAAINSMPGAVGLNNHRGSMATTDRALMQPLMDELKSRGMFFIDSRTIGSSIAYDTAIKTGVPSLENNLFLDNVSDKSVIWSYYKQAEALALKQKKLLVVICHFRPQTILFLEELNKVRSTRKVKFVTPTEILKEKIQK